jgi:hypothetical protein
MKLSRTILISSINKVFFSLIFAIRAGANSLQEGSKPYLIPLARLPQTFTAA